MLSLQVVPRAEKDAYKLLRDKVTHEAHTWYWSNKAKTRLQHVQLRSGYIEVGSTDGILVAQIRPRAEGDLFFLAEKFVGRLVAWFADDIVAINIQSISEQAPNRRKAKRAKS